jgi:hypothetical protein
VVVAIARLPLAAAVHWLPLSRVGLTYIDVSGTVWSGQVSGLAWRGVSLGDVAVGVRPSPWLLDGFRVKVAVNGTGPVDGAGVLWIGLGSLGARDTAGQIRIATLPVILPLDGTVDVRIAKATFSREGCETATAEITTDALTRNPGGLPWHGPVLSGRVTCANGAIVIPLQGESGTETVSVTMTVSPDGSFTVNAEARTGDQAVANALTAVGFRDVNGILTLQQQGRWG